LALSSTKIVLIYVKYFSYWKFGVIYRVRLEKGNDGKQRGGKSENTADTQQVTTAPYNNATVLKTSVNNTGRAKQSSQVGDSIKSLANQLLGSHYFEKDSDEDSSDSMVDEDVRTPPKLKTQVKHKQNSQHVKLSPKTTEIPVHENQYDSTEEEINHKGIAVPVIIEDDDDVEETIEKLTHTQPIVTRQTTTTATQKKKPTTTMTTSKPYYETTSSDGVSTWVLLSGSSAPTTPSHLQNKGNKTPTGDKHKATHTTAAAELLKPAHTSEVTQVSNQGFGGGFGQWYSPLVSTVSPTSSTRKPDGIGSLSSQSYTPGGKPNLHRNETLELLKLTKTRKPNPTRATTVKTKVLPITTTTTPIPSSPMKRNPVIQQNNNHKTQLRVTTVSPVVMTTNRHKDTEDPLRHTATITTTENEIVSFEENGMEGNSTDATAETSTKRPRRPTGGNKKRKKNKNRRRRPSNRPEVTEDPESKTSELNATSTDNKVAVKERPLSTRIYNYLAREVMPSVGVGLIGLVVTAGLAGLIMYPFGGLVTRRTYEEVPPHYINPNAYNYHGEYEGEIDNSQSEEEVFGKLLEGMNDKGEFTYGGMGEDTTGFAGPPGIGGDEASEQGFRYKTGDGSRQDMHTYSPLGEVMHETHHEVRYGGRVEDVSSQQHTGVRYDSASYTGMGDNKAAQPFSHSSQQSYGTSFGSGNAQERYRYGGMATRSGDIGDSAGDSQPLRSGTVNTVKKQYTAGSVHVNSNTHHHVSTESTVYGGPYYTPSYVQAYTRNVHGGLSAVRGHTHGNVQRESSTGMYHSGSTEQSLESKHKTESNSAGNLQYRKGVFESGKQYRDVGGTQPRSGGTIIAVSVGRQPGLQVKEGETEIKQLGENEMIENISRAEGSVGQRTYETQKNERVEDRSAGSSDSGMEYRGMLHISSRISPELQNRGSPISGFVEHGPRSLRRRRDANVFTDVTVSDEDLRNNEIDGNNLKRNVGQNEFQNSPGSEKNPMSTHTVPKNVVALSDDKQISGGTVKRNLGSQITETETSTVNGRETTDPIKGTRNVDQGPESPTESTTLDDILLTTTAFNSDATDVEGVDLEEEKAEHETTSFPEITTKSDETSTKDLQMETTKIPETQFSLIGIFRRIARFKLQMGLNLLKSTSQALTNYIEGVQRRMDKDYNSSNGRSNRTRSSKRGA
jgi:hypothetical protein